MSASECAQRACPRSPRVWKSRDSETSPERSFLACSFMAVKVFILWLTQIHLEPFRDGGAGRTLRDCQVQSLYLVSL